MTAESALKLPPDERDPLAFDAHRLAMIELARRVNEAAGIVGEPKMTAQELRASQRASGIRPGDNEASRELLRMRYGDDYEQE